MLTSIINPLRATICSLSNTVINILRGIWRNWSVTTASPNQISHYCTNNIKYSVDSMNEVYKRIGMDKTPDQIDGMAYRAGVCEPTLIENLSKHLDKI